MSEPVFAIIPLTLEIWSTGEELSADCLNDLHSFGSDWQEKVGIVGFKPYENNTLRFRITTNPDFKIKPTDNSRTMSNVLMDVGFFEQRDYCLKIDTAIIEIQQLTATKLLKIVLELHQMVRKL